MRFFSSIVHLITVLYMLQNCSISAFLIGIDLGSEFIKVSLYQQGKAIEMVENYQSKTKTPFALVFTDHDRLFGSEALAKRNKFPEQLFLNMHYYIGKIFNVQESIEQITDNFNALNLEEDSSHKGYVFSINYNKNDYSLSIEEIFAMIFRYIQTFSSKFSQSEIKDCVISIPSFFNYKQRLAVIQSAKIAGLRLNMLINQNIAAAVKYSLDNSFKKETNSILYNMGASYTQVILVSIVTSKNSNNKYKNAPQTETQYVKIIDETWDEKLGGTNFDNILTNFIIKKYNLLNDNEKEIDRLLNKNSNKPLIKLMNKLRPYIIKYKEILSANKEISINIPGITESGNLHGKLSRDELNEASATLSRRILKPIMDLLKRNDKITVDNLESIELIGGGTRMPFVKEILKKKFSAIKLGTHINGDDAIALGTAFMGANYTSDISGLTVNGKRIDLLNNGVNYNISITITDADNSIGDNTDNDKLIYCDENTFSTKISESCSKKLYKETIVFKSQTNFNSQKMINFIHDRDFIVTVYETLNYQSNLTAGDKINSNQIMKYKSNLSDIVKSIKNEEGFTRNFPKIYLKFKMDELGILSLKAELSYEVDIYLKMNKDDKGNLNFFYTTDIVHPLNAMEIVEEISKINANKNFSKTEKEKFIKKIKDEVGSHKVEIKKIDVDLTEEYFEPFPLNKTEIIKSKVKLNNFDNINEIRIKHAELRNTFESIMYNRKVWLESDDAAKYTKEEELIELKNELKKIEEVYENEQGSATSEILSDKISNVTQLFKVIDGRIHSHNSRNSSIELFESKVKSINKEIELLKNQNLHKTEIEEMKKKNQNSLAWLRDMIKQQEKLTLVEAPILTEEIVKDKLSEITNHLKKIKQI